MAHITGGGITEKVPRMLPGAVQARLERASWTRPAVFDWLAHHGRVDDAEMLRVFNCGIGMAIVVEPGEAERCTALLQEAGETVFTIGRIEEGPGTPAVEIIGTERAWAAEPRS